MNKLPNTSQKSPDNLLFILFIGALAAYLMPWVVTPGVSLHLGAYDLAEWVSLILPARPLTTVLLLRLPPACLAVMVALIWGRTRFSPHWWIALLVVIVMAVALLPPFEFLSQREDVNYRQQFFLSVGTLLISTISLTPLLDRARSIAVLITGVTAIGVSIAGVSQAQAFMQGLALPVQLGFGGVIFPLLVVLIAIGGGTFRGYSLRRSGRH